MYFLYVCNNLFHLEILREVNVRGVLTSYFYVRQDNDLFKELLRSKFEILMLDSGTATFLGKVGLSEAIVRKKENKEKIKDSIEKYQFEYENWLKEYSKYFDYVVEFDVDKIIGYEKVLEFRKRLLNIVSKEKLLPVWHKTLSLRDFEDMCKEFPYVGIADMPSFSTLNGLFAVAKKYKTRLHGFALTRKEYVKRFPFYTVDSSSWISGSKYGITYWIEKNDLMISNNKSDRKRIKNLECFKGYNLDWNKIMVDNGKEVDKMNIIAWKKFEEIIDKLHREKRMVYWQSFAQETDNLCKQKEILPKEVKVYSKVEVNDSSMDNSFSSEQVVKTKGCNHPEFVKRKGKIQEILKNNPELEQKRIQRLKEVNRLNAYNFKHGKYMSYLPLYCNFCYAQEKCPSYVKPENETQLIVCNRRKEFQKIIPIAKTRNREGLLEMLDRLRAIQVDRALINLYFEKLDGAIQDKGLTNLIKTIEDSVIASYRLLEPHPNVVITNQNIVSLAKEVIDKKCIKEVIDILEQKLEKQNGNVVEEK